MFSHITVGVTDLARAGRFYDALLAPLGFNQRKPSPMVDRRLCAGSGEPPARILRPSPVHGAPAQAGNGNMVAFLAPDPGAVDAAYAAGMAAGARTKARPVPAPIMAPAITAPICAIRTATRCMWCTGAILRPEP